MHQQRRTILTMLAASGVSALHTPTTFAGALFGAPVDTPAPSLKHLANKKGLHFGSAIGMAGRGISGIAAASGTAKPSGFHDPAYRALIARECSVIVAENETKWQAIQAQAGKFTFGPADAMFAWAKGEGILIRGHTLVWQTEKWLPKWVSALDFGSQAGLVASRILEQHIRTVCQHFGQAIYSYDVVNEAVDPASGNLRENSLTKALGAVEEIDLAFRLAQQYAPHAKLVYNDYMRGGSGSAKHRTGVLRLLESLKARGTPIHALGLQSHIGSWDASADQGQMREWRRFLDEVTAFDLDLLITEFDVNDRQLVGDIPSRDAGVAALARDYLALTLSYPRLRDFLVWGMADHLSWLQTWREAPRLDGLAMRPCPYDAQLQAKPLYRAVAEALQAMPMRSPV